MPRFLRKMLEIEDRGERFHTQTLPNASFVALIVFPRLINKKMLKQPEEDFFSYEREQQPLERSFRSTGIWVVGRVPWLVDAEG